MSKSRQPEHIEPLAIVGIGCTFPKARNAGEYWSNIREGVDAITEVPATHWKPSDYFDQDPAKPDMTYAHRGGFIDPYEFDPLLYGMSPNNIEATDTTQLFGMIAAREALLDAGYATGKDSNDGRQFDRDRTSVILGVTGTLELVIPLGARLGHPIWRQALRDSGVEDTVAEEVVKRIAEGYVPWQENSFPGLLGNVAAGRIANRFDLGGTNCVVDAACASSLSAIHMAAMELHEGRCDMAISGGIDTFNDIFMYMCFSKTPALSPSGNSRPFHKEGDGTILGEGIGVLILKRLSDARQDEDRIYAIIRGIGTSSDGKGNAIYAPSPSGQQKALRDAYQASQVSPRTIELVEAHGTGTRVGDAVEAEALSAVYREDRPQGTWCAIGSVKSMIGHTKAAAGVAGLIKTALALKHKVLPPTIKVDLPLEILNPGTAPVYINTVKRPWVNNSDHPRRAAVSSFGFGGSNFHAVLEEMDHTRHSIDWDGRVVIFAFSSDDRNSLPEKLAAFGSTSDWAELRKAAAESLLSYDPSRKFRLVLFLEKDRTDINRLVQSCLSMLSSDEKKNWVIPDGASFGSGKTSGSLAFMFPGQGAQYPGMLRDLACQFPQMLSALDDANSALGADEEGLRISDRIFPIPVFDSESMETDRLALQSTDRAQPAIGAVSKGAARVLDHFNVRAAAAAGHSFGELTALNYAGWFTDQDLFRLAKKRGELMQIGEGDRGTMLAVMSSPEQLYEIIEEHQLDLIIANHNAPSQLVLSGATEQVEKAESILAEKKIRSSRLPVAAAFHSSFVAGAEKPLAEFINKLIFTRGRIPVYSNTTSENYSDDVDQARALLSGQLAKPVEFVNEIENMYTAGIRTFVEVGPSSIITGLVSRILDDREHHAIALDASKGKRSGLFDLAKVLAQLSTLGYQCDLGRWDAGFLDTIRKEKKPAMTVTISGANYVLPRKKSGPVLKRPSGDQGSAGNKVKAAPATSPVQAQMVHPDPQGISNALQATQQSILALQKLQEQTAQLHKQYLEGQDAAQQTIRQLIEQQQQLISGQPVTPIAIPATASVKPDPKAAIPEPLLSSALIESVEMPAVDNEHTAAPGADYRNILLEVVAEKTGYPVDMLSLDMSLDTDLGIDSIKRVEILSALQEKLPGIQKIQPEDLGTFQLLQHIVEYLADGDRETSVITDLDQVDSLTHVFQQALLEVVAEKTGYPADMLNLDMNLDSDLGIDSIKRVEILSALQERMPEAPAVKPEELGTLQTLRQIVEFMDAGEITVTTPVQPEPADSSKFQTALLEVVAEKTGYPVDMLNLDMNLDSDLGIDSIKRVEILSALQDRMPGAPAVEPEELGKLQTLRQIVDHMHQETAGPVANRVTQAEKVADRTAEKIIYKSTVGVIPLTTSTRPGIRLPENIKIIVTDDGTDLPTRVCEILKDRELNAVVLPLDTVIKEPVAALLVMVPASADEKYVQDSFNLIQQAGKHGVNALACITRLGGNFGIKNFSLACPESAALHGIIKTAAREWKDVNCKVIDIQDNYGSQDPVTAIVDEVLTKGPMEVGITDGLKITLALDTEEIRNTDSPDNPFSGNDVVIVTGGARGITAEIAYDLARTFRVNLLLLGRSPQPEPEPEWLQELVSEPEIKKAIISQQAADQNLTPRAVEDEYQKISCNREIQSNLERIQETGVRVIYRSVDVRNPAPVAQHINYARTEIGPIAGIIHGAGVLADSFILDKTMDQFNRVFATKVEGIRSLLQATVDDNLKILALFSSSTARFGRKGQVDYAAANEVLNKIAQREKLARPDCRVISVNWGPWEGGMVTPQLRKIFENEGVGLIPLELGANYLTRAIAEEGPVEIVVLGSKPEQEYIYPDTDRDITPDMQLAFDRNLNVTDFPVLRSHIMNGRPVLPAALTAEWLAHGAIHNNPGLSFLGFDDFRILKGVILENGETVPLQIMAGAVQITGKTDKVIVEMRSDKAVHARATIILGTDYEHAVLSGAEEPSGTYPYQKGEYYENSQLFHGRDLQGIESVSGCSDSGIVGIARTAPQPADWVCHPVRSSWLADPLVMDSCFQLMILWCFQNSGAGSLPTVISKYRQYTKDFPRDKVKIVSRIVKTSEHNVISDIEILDLNGNLLAKLEGYECVVDRSLNEAFKKNQSVDVLD